MRLLWVLVLFTLAFPVFGEATGVQQSDFVAYTNQVIDAMDGVEAVFDSLGTPVAAKVALNDLDVALKKYKRVKVGNKSLEKEIMYKATMTHVGYVRVLEIYGALTPQHAEARQAAAETRKLFATYKSRLAKK